MFKMLHKRLHKKKFSSDNKIFELYVECAVYHKLYGAFNLITFKKRKQRVLFCNKNGNTWLNNFKYLLYFNIVRKFSL